MAIPVFEYCLQLFDVFVSKNSRHVPWFIENRERAHVAVSSGHASLAFTSSWERMLQNALTSKSIVIKTIVGVHFKLKIPHMLAHFKSINVPIERKRIFSLIYVLSNFRSIRLSHFWKSFRFERAFLESSFFWGPVVFFPYNLTLILKILWQPVFLYYVLNSKSIEFALSNYRFRPVLISLIALVSRSWDLVWLVSWKFVLSQSWGNWEFPC